MLFLNHTNWGVSSCDDIEFVTEFPCLLGHPVLYLEQSMNKITFYSVYKGDNPMRVVNLGVILQYSNNFSSQSFPIL